MRWALVPHCFSNVRAFFAECRVSRQLLEITRLILNVLRELIPDGGLGFSEAGELIDAVVQPAAQRVIAELDAVHHDDRKPCGQAAILREVEQGRHEFSPGQVTGSAKNDEHRRFELVICLQIGGFVFHGAFTSSLPQNS